MLHSFLRKSNAVAFVEAAIIAPVLILLMLNSFDLALLSNSRSVVENVSSNLSKMFGYLSIKNNELLSELALASFGQGTTAWLPSVSSPRLQEYIGSNTTFNNHLTNLSIPLLSCGSAYCEDGINVHYTVYECDTPNNSYFEKDGFLSGGYPLAGSSNWNELEATILSTSPPSNCASYTNKKYIRLISFSDFTSPFSSIFRFQLNHVTISVLSNNTPLTF